MLKMKEIQACLKVMTHMSYVDNYVETVDYFRKSQKNEKYVIFEFTVNERKYEGINQ